MTKTLKDFLEVYKPKSPDEQKFVDKHVTIKHKDRNGNGDDVFNGNTKTIKRKEERHGYDVGEDEKVYEEVEDLEEAPFDAASKAQDRHYEKQTQRVQNMLDKYAIRGMSYKDAVKKISSPTHILHKEITPLHEDVDLDEVLDEAINLLMSIDEKTLTPAEMKKREEVVKAIKRGNPKMDKSMAYAIATKTAKRVAEGTMPTADEPSEHDKKMAQKVRDLLAKEKKPVKEEVEELGEGIATYDKKGKLVGNYKDLETAKKLKPGHHYAPKGTVLAALDRVGKPVWAPTFKEEVEDLDESAKIAAHLIKRYGDNVRKSHVRSAANDFGVGYVALAHAVRKKLGVNRLEEEQIDEISSKTLGSYSKKARKEAEKRDDPMHRYSGRLMASKKTNPARGGYKLTKVAATFGEEADQIDEISAAKLTDYTAKASDARSHRDMPTAKLDKRYKSMALAHEKIRGRHAKVPANEEAEVEEAVGDITVKTKSPADAFAQHTNQAKKKISVPKDPKTGKTLFQKMTQEEVEGLDELSKKTLGNYAYRAASELGSRGITTGLKIAADEPTEKNFKKMANRQKGVATAVKKLTKEDIINRSIEKYVPEEVKFTPEERLLKRLDGLSEAHVNTLLGLFEALNKDNQNKMIETVETREGINQLLNFALENRGE